jgi:hypothetical protein
LFSTKLYGGWVLWLKDAGRGPWEIADNRRNRRHRTRSEKQWESADIDAIAGIARHPTQRAKSGLSRDPVIAEIGKPENFKHSVQAIQTGVAQKIVQLSLFLFGELTKSGAKLMQFHSGSSNIVPPSSALKFEAFVGSSWPDDW